MTIEFKSKIKSPFISIPVEIEKMGLDVYARAVYQRISYRAGGHSSHFESQENMAKALFISPRQVIRKIQDLEKRNMIEVERRAKSKNGHFLTNVIVLEDPSNWIYPNHVTVSHTAICTTVTPPCDSQSHITRSQEELDPKRNLNADAQKPAAIKKLKKPTWKPTSKMKTWDEKTELEKMDCVLHKAIDAHDLAIEMRQAKYFPYADAPDLLAPILNEHGIDKCKEFFEWLKNENKGCDVRKLSKAIKQFARPANPISAEPILVPEPAKTFPDEIIKQVETNKMYIPTNPVKFDDVKIETFPIRLKKFYDSLKSKREKISLKKEVSLLGIDNFLKMRATMILRCTYEELFTESVCQSAFF